MGQQARTVPSNQGEKRAAIVRATSTAMPGIPNYGVTEITTAGAATDWVLDAPVEGCRKVLYCVSATTGLKVHASTGTSVKFSSTGLDTIQFDGGGDKVVELIGINSTLWVISNYIPASTAIVISS